VRWQGSGKTKWVKRLNLIYAGESRQAFGYRLRQARKRWAEVGGPGYWAWGSAWREEDSNQPG
jgi:hypothetical protein